MKFIKWLYRLLNTLVLIGLVLSYLAPFVDPRLFWPISFFGLSFTFWLGAAALMIIWGIMLKHKFVLYSLVLMLIGSPLILRSISWNDEDKKDEAEIRIASFNSFGFGHTQNNSLALDSVLRAKSIDIVVLHEWRRNRTKVKKQPFQYQKVIKRGVNTGTQIMSKYPIVSAKKIQLEETYSDASYADVIIENDTIRIFMLHLESNQLKPRDYHRITDFDLDSTYKEYAKGMMSRIRRAMKKRASQVEIVVQEMRESPYPLVICMDLNDTPQSFAYQQLSRGLDDAFVEAGKGWEGTYVKPFPFLRIDFILYDDLIKCVEYESTNRVFSDHKLIFAGFTFNH
jgi:endonuclease/exonuclease/phosphatase family metal-dependent hydrolase